LQVGGSDVNDTTPFDCARVDHVNSLQEELPEQQAASEEVRHQLEALEISASQP
jgi:hypothetical protein